MEKKISRTKPLNVLLTNSGRRTYFIKYLINLRKSIKNLKIHVSDCNKYCSTFGIKNIKKHLTPEVIKNKKKYIKKLFSIVKKNKINIIIPLTDHDILLLSKNKNLFKNINCDVIVSNEVITKTLTNKLKASMFCQQEGILVPATIPLKSIKSFNKSNKVVVKKIIGSSSDGFKVLHKNFNIKKKRNIFYQKFIKGSELHFDILNDLNGNYISSCIKRKLSMRGGETDIAKVIDKKKYEMLAKKISRKIKHVGNLDCDAIEHKNGKIYFIDFNLRFGGGYAFTHLAGLNFLKYLLFFIINKKINLSKKKINDQIFSKGISIYKIDE